MRTRPGGGGFGGATWLTTTDCPPIVSVTDRACPLFGATVYESDPDPFWPAAVVVIQVGMPAAVHAHPAIVAIDTDPDAPTAGASMVAGVTV